MIREVASPVSITSALVEQPPPVAGTFAPTDLIDASAPRGNTVFDESPRRTEPTYGCLT